MNAFLIGFNIFIIVSFLIITSVFWIKKNNSPANILLGLFILLHVLVLSFNLAVYCRYLDPRYYFLCSIPACLIGPSAWLYCKLLLSGKKEPKRPEMLLHLIPAIVFPLLLILLKKMQVPEDHKVYGFLLGGSGEFPDILKLIITFHIAGYYFHTWHLIKKRSSGSSGRSSNPETLKINWARNFIFSNALFIVAFFVLHLISLLSMNTFRTGSSLVSPMICLFLYFSILKKAVIYNPVFSETKENEQENKIVNPVACEHTLNELEGRLLDILENKKPYLDKELSLGKLSLLANASPKHVSQLINLRYQKNFNDFINSYRVDESRKMLHDPDMYNLKLEAIAEAAGFNSRTSFYSAFKKFTGNTPAFYRKKSGPSQPNRA